MDVAGVRAAEAALRSAGLAGANGLPALLDATASADDATATAALHASRRSLGRLTAAAAAAVASGDDAGAPVAAWLAAHTAEWLASLPALALRRAPPPAAAADDDNAGATAGGIAPAAGGGRHRGGAGPGVGVADAALAVAAAAGAAAWRPVAAAVLGAVPPVPAAATLNEVFVAAYDDVKLWTLEVATRLCRERTAREVAVAASDAKADDAAPSDVQAAGATSALGVSPDGEGDESAGGGGQESPAGTAAASAPPAGADGVVDNVLAMLSHAVIPLPLEAGAWTPVLLSTKLGGPRPAQQPRESRKRKAHLPPPGAAGTTDVTLPYKALRAAYSDCWVAALGAPTRPGGGGELDKLLPLAGTVLPRLAAPLRLADYLTAAYNRGGPPSIVALDGLYALIRDHGLDYPAFYTSLYVRLTPETLFYARRRQAFLAAVPAFLAGGGHLPAAVIAAFVKRLARLALVAPPHGAMWCLRLALELIRKHPAVSVLVHRRYVDAGAALGAGGVLTPAPAFTSFFEPPPSTGGALVKGEAAAAAATAAAATAAAATAAAAPASTPPHAWGGADVYDAAAANPAAARALDSCLWELAPLRSHVSPAVAAVAAAFTADVTAIPRPRPPPGDVADCADLSYADVFHAEFDKRRSLTPLAYTAPSVGDGLALEGVLRWR